MSVERKLLSSDDLKELYRVTGPNVNPRPKLFMVVRESDESDWRVESRHSLRGYRACKINLNARVRQYEGNGLWPNQCDLGIGIFEGDTLIRVLKAVDLGNRLVKDKPVTLPLDDILSAVGKKRSDFS